MAVGNNLHSKRVHCLHWPFKCNGLDDNQTRCGYRKKLIFDPEDSDMSNHPLQSKSNLPVCLGIVLYVCSFRAIHCLMVSTSCGVGQSAVLPCVFSSLESPPPPPYIQWLSVSETVFERMGTDKFEGQGYEGRADVPQQMLEQGNCSLVLTDVQLTDSGLYESYLVVGKTKVKRKVLLGSIQFNVRDHKLKESVERGKDLVLELYTPQARQVLFQKRRVSETVLWRKDEERQQNWNPRVKHDGWRVVLRDVGWEDEGTYRVLDEHGLALSTVMVTVTEPQPDKPEQTLQRRESTDYSDGSRSCPALTFLLLCVIMHYFI